MKTFIIEITETLQRRIAIESENINDAIQKASRMHRNCQIIIDSDNLSQVDIRIIEECSKPKCPHCGRELKPSVVNNYLWYCEDCDEDFTDSEV